MTTPIDPEAAAAWRTTTLRAPDQRYRPQNCRSCGAPMAFAQTLAGKAMPVELDALGQPTQPHFVSCPDSKRWSKPKSGQIRFEI